MPTHVLRVCREAFEFLTGSADGEESKLEKIIEFSDVDEIKIVRDDDLTAEVHRGGCATFTIVGTRSEIDAAILLINYEIRNFESANKHTDRNLPVSRDTRVSESTSQLDVHQVMRKSDIEVNKSELSSANIGSPVTFHSVSVTKNATPEMTQIRVGNAAFVNDRLDENIAICFENTLENKKANNTHDVDMKTTSDDDFHKALGAVIQKYGFESFLNQPLVYADYVCKDNMKVEVLLAKDILVEALIVDLQLSSAVGVTLEGSKCVTQLVIPFDRVRLIRKNVDPNMKFCVGDKVDAKLNFESDYAKCDLWCAGIVKSQSQQASFHSPDSYFVEFTADPLSGFTKEVPSNKMRQFDGSKGLRKKYFSSAVVPIRNFDAEIINQLRRPNVHKSYLTSLGAEMLVYDSRCSRMILISKSKLDLRQVAEFSAIHFNNLSKAADLKIPDLRDIAVSKPICGPEWDLWPSLAKINFPRANDCAKSKSKLAQGSTTKKIDNDTGISCQIVYRQNEKSSRASYSKIASANVPKEYNQNPGERAYSEKFNVSKNVIATIGTDNIEKAKKISGLIGINVNKQTVEIFGESVECVKKARSMLEYQKENIKLPFSMIGGIVGKRECNLKIIECESGVKASFHLHRPPKKRSDEIFFLALVGPVRNVCHAKIVVENRVSTLLLPYIGIEQLDEQNRLDLEVEACSIGKAAIIDVREYGLFIVESENGKKTLVPFSQLKFPQSKLKCPITKDAFHKEEIPIEVEFGPAAATYDHRNFQIATCASSCVYRNEAHVLRIISLTARTKVLVDMLKNVHLSNMKEAYSCFSESNLVEENESKKIENENCDIVEQGISSYQRELEVTIVRTLKIPPHLISHVNENGLSVADFVVRDKILSMVRNQPGILSADLTVDEGCLSLKIRSFNACEIEQAAKYLQYVQDEIVIPTDTGGMILEKLKSQCDVLIEFESSQYNGETYTVIGTRSSVSRAKELYFQCLDKYGRYCLVVNIAQFENLRQYMGNNLQEARSTRGICSVKEYPDHFEIYANHYDSCILSAEALTFSREYFPARKPVLSPEVLDNIVERSGVAEILLTVDETGQNNSYQIIGQISKLEKCKKMISEMEIYNLASKSVTEKSHEASDNDSAAKALYLHTPISNLSPDLHLNLPKCEKSGADYITCKIVKANENQVTDRILKLCQNVTGITTVDKVGCDEYEIKGSSEEAINLAERALNYVEENVTVEAFIMFDEVDANVKKELISALPLELEKNLESYIARNLTIFYTFLHIFNNLRFSFVTAHIVGPQKLVEFAKNVLDSDVCELGKFFVLAKTGDICGYENVCLPRSRKTNGVTCVVESPGVILIRGLTQEEIILAYKTLKIEYVTEYITQMVANKITPSVVEELKKKGRILGLDISPAFEKKKSRRGMVSVRIAASEVDLMKAVAAWKKFVKAADNSATQ